MKRTPTNAIRYSVLLPLMFAFCVAGCLITETTEYKVTFNEDGKSGTLLTVMTNVQSSDAEAEKQQKDFEQAIEQWKGDEYLVKRIKDGLYVKDRNLAIEDSVLVWRERALFADPADFFKSDLRNDTLRFAIKGDQKIVATNGTILRSKDSTVVVWKLPVKEISIKIKETDFKPTSDFTAKFKAYIEKTH